MQWKKAHFIGIGGVGMSATAKLLKDAGTAVTGSDEEVYPPISDFLKRENFDVRMPYDAKNIPEDADIIVIGKNARLVPAVNAEVAAAYASKKHILSFPEVLAALSDGKESVVVAGSYGKSTSTALLAHVLESVGTDPSYFIGASPLTPNLPARMGAGALFVLEGDEYPASNTDSRSKFLLMHPHHALITPLAHDHFNVFPTAADYLKPFYELATLVPADGTLVVCADGPLSKEFLKNVSRPVITYGLNTGDFYAQHISWGEKTSFDIVQNNSATVHVETSQLGEHSVQNIVGVAALVFSLKLVPPEQFAAAVASFKGIRRRLDKKSSQTSVPVYEGFGSSYDKLKSAIAAMERHFAARRLLVIFEPNTIGWRSRAALHQYDDVFAGAQRVYIFNPPHDGKATEVSAQEIAERVSAAGIPARAFETADEILSALKTDLAAGDCILLSSSGAMGGLTESVPKLAEELFPA